MTVPARGRTPREPPTILRAGRVRLKSEHRTMGSKVRRAEHRYRRRGGWAEASPRDGICAWTLVACRCHRPQDGVDFAARPSGCVRRHHRGSL